MVPRRPGQHAREVTRRLAIRLLVGLALVLLTGVLAGLIAGFRSSVFVLVELLVIGGMFAIDRYGPPMVERRGRGATGEEHVGAILDALVTEGWLAVHDLNTGRGNIDHVVIGPAGVFTVETKSHGGRIAVESIERRMLSQAYAQAKHIEGIVGGRVEPLLVFSRAFLSRPVSRHRGVLVLPARMLAAHLRRREAVLTPDAVGELHGRIAALQPTV